MTLKRLETQTLHEAILGVLSASQKPLSSISLALDLRWAQWTLVGRSFIIVRQNLVVFFLLSFLSSGSFSDRYASAISCKHCKSIVSENKAISLTRCAAALLLSSNQMHLEKM